MELKIHQLRAQFVKSDMPGGIVQRTKGLNKLKSKNQIVKPDASKNSTQANYD